MHPLHPQQPLKRHLRHLTLGGIGTAVQRIVIAQAIKITIAQTIKTASHGNGIGTVEMAQAIKNTIVQSTKLCGKSIGNEATTGRAIKKQMQQATKLHVEGIEC
jgi:hypothetical protein